MSARFDPDAGRVLALETLFAVPPDYLTQNDDGGNDFYDVSADGERFLMARAYSSGAEEESAPAIVLVQGFFEVLKERVAN